MAKLLQSAAVLKKRLREFSNEGDKQTSSFLIKPIESVQEKKVKRKKSSKQDELKEEIENKDNETVKENVIYLGHIPNGFFEKEMRRFFSQFGLVKRIKLFRSAKTQRSKGYAFVEFDSEETAKVVSEAMNGYMMHDKTLVANVVPKEKIHDGMFKRPKRRETGENEEAEGDSDPAGQAVTTTTPSQGGGHDNK